MVFGWFLVAASLGLIIGEVYYVSRPEKRA